MRNRLNLVSALAFQAVSILSGLIVPRMILLSMGSEINGLISSINQFLGFISLLEGGLGAVVLAELYAPIEKKDYKQIKAVMLACTRFFEKIALIFVVYTLVLCVIYPLLIYKNQSILFTGSLIIIISVSTILQYLFCITNKLLLQAEQKVYIVNFVSMTTAIINFLITVVVIKIYPNVHVLKLLSAFAFILQPVFYRVYISHNYKEIQEAPRSHFKLENRWSGFSQNLAHFVNMNTDIALITVFGGVSEVSVYSVYMLALNALRNVILTGANSYQSALGKYIAIGNETNTYEAFKKFEKYIWIASIVMYGTSIILIVPFVNLYTNGVKDANYYRPIFAIIMITAQFVFSVREPYRLLILAAGRFKETNFGSYMEAIINLVVSLALIQKMGIIGVAIGTLVAGIYRLIYFIYFLQKDIIHMSYFHVLPYCISFSLVFLACIVISRVVVVSDYLHFVVYGVAIVFCLGGIVFGMFLLISKAQWIIEKRWRKI